MSKESDKCKKYLNKTQLEVISDIGTIADQSHERCFVVGGIVRDCLLGKESDDLDFVCTDVEKITQGLVESKKAKGIGQVETEKYLTKIVFFENGEKADIVEPRKERYVKDSIKPIVEKGTLEDDALRRDFTINTLRLGVNKENWLEIDDPTKHGLDDLSNMILDTPLNPDQTFEDDPTRMLRAVRFASCKKMKMTKRVIRSIQEKRNEINRIPKELIHKELIKGGDCDNYYEIMDTVGLLEIILPEVTNLKGVFQNPKGHTTDAFNHTIRYVDELPHDSTLRLVGLLHDIGKASTCDEQGHCYKHEEVSAEQTEEILRKYKFSNEEIKRIKRLVGSHMELNNLVIDPLPTKKQMKRFLFKNKDILNDLEVMSRADALSDHPNKDEMVKELDTVVHQLHEIQLEIQDIESFTLSINGNDIRSMGFEGKEIGKVKNEVSDLVKEGSLPNDKKVLTKYIKENYQK